MATDSNAPAIARASALSELGTRAAPATLNLARAAIHDPDPMVRWSAVPRAMRAWALDHPHEWGLIFGSPVPGYEAPQETIAPYIRLAQALVRPIVEAHQAGTLRPAPIRLGTAQPLAAALQPVADRE